MEGQFEGVVMKGVTQDYRWEQLKDFLFQETFQILETNLQMKYYFQLIANRLSINVEIRFQPIFRIPKSAT